MLVRADVAGLVSARARRDLVGRAARGATLTPGSPQCRRAGSGVAGVRRRVRPRALRVRRRARRQDRRSRMIELRPIVTHLGAEQEPVMPEPWPTRTRRHCRNARRARRNRELRRADPRRLGGDGAGAATAPAAAPAGAEQRASLQLAGGGAAAGYRRGPGRRRSTSAGRTPGSIVRSLSEQPIIAGISELGSGTLCRRRTPRASSRRRSGCWIGRATSRPRRPSRLCRQGSTRTR